MLKDIDLPMLSRSSRAVLFEDEFMLADNFDMEGGYDEVSLRLINSSHPFKSNFTMTLFCVGGYIRITMNLKEYTLRAGDLLIAVPDSIGECIEISTDCKIGFMASVGKRYMNGDDSTLSLLFVKYLMNNSLVHLPDEAMKEFLAVYTLMRQKVMQPKTEFTRSAILGYLKVLSSIGYQWISEYYNAQQSAPKPETRQQTILNRFLELVQLNHKEQRSVAFYADKLCLTPKYLSQVVYQVSGRYAGDWITDYVILEAKALLKSKKYTVAQVCDMLNFANPSFFGKYFKAAVGCSPRKYMMG